MTIAQSVRTVIPRKFRKIFDFQSFFPFLSSKVFEKWLNINIVSFLDATTEPDRVRISHFIHCRRSRIEGNVGWTSWELAKVILQRRSLMFAAVIFLRNM